MTSTDSETEYNAIFDQIQQCGDIISSILIIYKFVTENSIHVSFNTDDLRQIALRSVHNDTSTYLWHINALIAASSDFEHLLLGIEMMFDRFLGNKHVFIKEKQKQAQKQSASNPASNKTKCQFSSGTICVVPSSSSTAQSQSHQPLKQQQQPQAQELRFDQGAHRALQQGYDEATERANIHRFLGNEVVSFANTRYDFEPAADREMKTKQSEQISTSKDTNKSNTSSDLRANQRNTHSNKLIEQVVHQYINDENANHNNSSSNSKSKSGGSKEQRSESEPEKHSSNKLIEQVVHQYINDENANHNNSNHNNKSKSGGSKDSYLLTPGKTAIELDDNPRDYMQKYRGKLSSPISFRMRQQKRMMQSERRVTSRNASKDTSTIDLSGKLQSIQDEFEQESYQEVDAALQHKFKTFDQGLSRGHHSMEPQILSPFNVSKFAKRVDLVSTDMDSSQFQRKNV
eukprot:CAMPEP_0197072820 /NCGR_PEP_ID=MMETSP1384-20130603/210287_1 /TAXON_ID=29189 /ORGANISM="Ammonia sp." /LENGTH=458 /DNA_ID=CAMNT_0042511641 /DNA_START=830 /DNA_END=2207 /DNA_ORIENTATION=-